MDLTPPAAGLRTVGRVRLVLDAKSAAKVNLIVAPGEELEVSEAVAADLVAGDPHFKPVTDDTLVVESAVASTAEVQPRARGRRRS